MQKIFDVVGKLFPKKEKTKPILNNPEVVADVASRVVYLPFDDADLGAPIPDEEKESLWGSKRDNKMVLNYVLEKTRYHRIIEDIKERFPGREIGLRGVMTSLNGDSVVQRDGGSPITVVDASKVIMSGTEKPGEDTILIARPGDVKDMEKFPERVEQYLEQSASNTLGRTNANRYLVDTLTPAILIFDMSEEAGIKQINGYEHRLPDDPVKRANVIIGVYPVDVRSLLPLTKSTE